jgi:hypothetical protein
MPRRPALRLEARRYQVTRCRLSLARSARRFRYRRATPAAQRPHYYPELRARVPALRRPFGRSRCCRADLWRQPGQGLLTGQPPGPPHSNYRCHPRGQWRSWPARLRADCQTASTEPARRRPIKEAQWQLRLETDPSGRRTLNILLNGPASPRPCSEQQTLRPIGDDEPQ